MNINEAKAIDEETAKAEASLIIDEAMKLGVGFPHYLLGWMMGKNWKDMAECAESWIEMQNFNLPEKD
jgi:hypothetical protein|tara:strand:+ start:516 stop:719 length:204 start_codon:yes stop_codon:yes gene_type:complete